MNLYSWAAWAAVLFFQNISFTYVSRARSSGSIFRHAKASVFSNGIWIFSQIIMLGSMFDILTGKHGRGQQLSAAAVYTLACLSGSLFAHWLAMKTEKGKNAVGFNKKYAQIPVEEWARVTEQLQALRDTQAKQDEPSPLGTTLESGTFRIVEARGQRVVNSNFTTREAAVETMNRLYSPSAQGTNGIRVEAN